MKFKTIAAGLLFLTVAGCATQYRNHGFVPSEIELSDLLVGVDTRDSVEDSFGAPSLTALVNDNSYFYVRSRVKRFAFRAPEVIERQVVAIRFDGQGVISNIERFGLEDGRVVTLERRVTESSVRDQTFLRQLLGNLGNFNPAAAL